MNRLFALLTLLSVTVAASGDAYAKGPRRGPKHPPRPPVFAALHAPQADPVPRELQSDLCANEERAEVDVRRQLTAEVRKWLAESGVDPKWQPPQRLVDSMIISPVAFEPVKVDDLDVVRAKVTADFSESRKHQFLELHRRQTGARRLGMAGGGLAVALIALAALSGYIRADEATKGYYTTRLRLLAAAGVGAASVAVYRVLS